MAEPKPKMFANIAASQFALGTNGLWTPQDFVNGAGRRDPDLFGTLDTLVKSQDLSTKDKASIDKQLEKKIGTLFRLYYNIWNSSVTWGAGEKPLSTPTTMLLREAARQSLIDRLLIGTRAFQARHVSQRVAEDSQQKGWMVRHKRHFDHDYKPDPDIDRRCREMEELILHPNPEVHGSVNGFRNAFVQMVKGELTIDRKVMITVKDSMGRVQSWHMLPPDDIKPRLQVLLRHQKQFKMPTIDAAISSIYEKFGVDTTNAAFIQEIDNQILGAWTAEECHVDFVNPSDELDRYGWGVSPLEDSLEATTLLMLGLYYNKQNFLSNYPEAFLFINGDVDQEGLEVFKKQIYAQIGTQGNQRLPVFATGDPAFRTELHRLRDSLTDMQFIQLLRFAIALKCAAYRAHPSEINFSPDLGERGAIISSDNQEDQIAKSTEEGFHSILDNESQFITGTVIESHYDDLCMFFSVEEAMTENQIVDLWTKKTALGDTIDEYRQARHKPPLNKVNPRLNGAITNSPFPLEYAQFESEQQQAEQQAQLEQQRSSGQGFSGMETSPAMKKYAGR